MKMKELRQTSAAREAQLTEARDDVLKYAQERMFRFKHINKNWLIWNKIWNKLNMSRK